MSRFFLELSYLGTNYCGWQVQNNAPTVQAQVESALSKLLSDKISVVGAGRTDTGVHAAYYVAHFDCDTDKDLSDDFMYHLNCILPKDISVFSIIKVSDDAHARFSATQREYKYYISRKKDPFSLTVSHQTGYELDISEMNRAARLLYDISDFTSFAKLHSDNKTNICKIYDANWIDNDNFLIFTVRADRFLRNMVRCLVGSFIDVGRGKSSVETFDTIAQAKERGAAGSSAPACGLMLTDIVYPESIFVRKESKR